MTRTLRLWVNTNSRGITNINMVERPQNVLIFQYFPGLLTKFQYMGNCQIKLQIGVPKFSILKLE